ncbi:MAG: hypothetical protein QXQ02_07735, partial [Halobacteria archaeon]
LPAGWTRTRRWVLCNPAHYSWLLVDFKTVRGEAISWLPKKGVKEEHRWQLSAYWHALKRKRLPLISTFLVLYWPMNEVFKDPVAPVLLEDKPLPEDQVFGYMQEVHEAVEEYKRELERTGNYLNSKLAPPPPREQKIFFNKRLGIYDVKLVPSWHERFCEFSPALCPRSKVEKIGHFTPDGKYVPRPGFEHIKPTIMFSKGS